VTASAALRTFHGTLMKVLFIAPLPPPVTGHSLVSKALLDDLATTHEVRAVDLSRDSQHDGEVTIKRVVAVAKSLAEIATNRGRADVIYLTISESVAGNMKDLCIYSLCMSSLSRMYVHLHGGSLRALLLDKHSILRHLNTMFIRRLAGVIVSGHSHLSVFDGMIDRSKIHIVPNFAKDHLFVSRDEVQEKFGLVDPLRILYISAMTALKGFDSLAEAFFLLPRPLQERVRIDFAGKFESQEGQERFQRRIAGVKQISYHGVVDDVAKQRLFAQAHVFCLPTEHLEGQPISILEAYASGCVVVTTVPKGISDIFKPSVQGFEIQPQSPKSIRAAIEQMLADPRRLSQIALSNRELATRNYRASIYREAMRSILERRTAEGSN
jgi:glycosyltransferase involved in cell wall biosynthesis